MSAIRTLITDDNGTMRKVLRAVLEGYCEIKIVGEASNGEEAIEQVRELRPDLVVMDVSMPRLDGLTAAELIKKFNPATEILIFSMHNVKEFIDSARIMGLSGFVLKEEGGTGLLNAVADIVRHRRHFPC